MQQAKKSQARQIKGTAKGQVRELKGTAKGQARTVARVAGDDVAELLGSVRGEAGRVTDEFGNQARGLMEETKVKIEQHLEVEARRLAGNLAGLGSQAVALAKGRPEQAGPLVEYAEQAATWLDSKAEAIEEKGADGVAADIADFAARRPGAFLLGAAALGLGVGRLVRAGALSPAEPVSPAPRRRASVQKPKPALRSTRTASSSARARAS